MKISKDDVKRLYGFLKLRSDIFAAVLELIGLWMIGSKNWIGFLFVIGSSLLWIRLGFKTKMYGLLLVCVPAIFINIRNILSWLNI
jgi:hypothetical protein